MLVVGRHVMFHTEQVTQLTATALGTLCLVFALAATTTTDNVRISMFDEDVKIELGIWLVQTTTEPTSGPDPWYCDQAESDDNCRTGNKDDACCQALQDKCNTLKTFSIFCT